MKMHENLWIDFNQIGFPIYVYIYIRAEIIMAPFELNES